MSEYPPTYPPPSYGFSNPSSLENEIKGSSGQNPPQPHVNWGQPQQQQQQQQPPQQQQWSQPQQQWGKATTTIPPPIPPVSPIVVVQDLSSVPNFMAWSILNILCCCWILGCVACFFSIQTDESKKNGDLQGALNNSRTARTINIVSTVLGLILNIVIIILVNTGSI